MLEVVVQVLELRLELQQAAEDRDPPLRIYLQPNRHVNF
jgi:hypothetical protein